MATRKKNDPAHPDIITLRKAENEAKKKDTLRRGKIVRDLKQGKSV